MSSINIEVRGGLIVDDLKFFQLFGEIDAELVQQANDDLNIWQKSQEDIVVCADGFENFLDKQS